MTSKGFITVAAGKWYCYLAQNLAISYKLFGNCKIPFYAITDAAGEKKLKNYFDGVIVSDELNYSFLDKINVYKYSPFDETIFLDADMSIIKDISFLFEEFEKNNSEVSCYGEYIDITEEMRPVHFGDAAIEQFGFTRYIKFGGGIYYLKKSKAADKVFDCIFNDLMPNYDKYQLQRFCLPFGNISSMADEPLMEVSMLINGMNPYNGTKHLMRHYLDNMMKTFKWDFKKRDCSFYWWGETVHPYIAHYATYNTWTLKYNVLSARLRDIYHRIWTPFSWFHVLLVTVKWIFSPRQLKRFFHYFLAHFTVKYWKYQISKIKRLFGSSKKT